ncbi:hypothetical protein N7478_011094 [Penicillium angulare]|uniref:uncharacterized protein n=1 Tax=Penicillium angulare TaxID=116970 RepID=UPI002540674B|nr:uncharacterized protein N7478_011094 [Penicillium angulare]KAJ5263489.1 hypothetical protein N7478_011094 [Penicillium angulare]
MSDDDEYYEWEDEYLFEDPVPDLVDELAQTSYYEAALFDDPNIYTEDYFSDWEYYTDDYYDDDPTVKESSLRAKTEPSPRKNRNKTKVRRTLPPQHPPLHLDLGSFQGVVWKASLEDDPTVAGAVQIYEPGQSDKVALLEDWREIFKSAQPALDKSRLRKRHAPVSLSGSVSGISGVQDGDGDEELGDDEGEEEGYEEGEGDSSDAMSDVLSLDQTNGSVDAGDVSNTTPELGQSPKDPGFAVEIPVKRGRKRKAETPVKKNTKAKASKPSVEEMRSHSKRVARNISKSDDGGSTGPVRRSARQKK